MSRHRVVLVTASSQKEARKIGMTLLKEKLAACVSIVPKVSSSYWWKGKIETASESLLIIKTEAARVPRLIRTVKQIHSYDVPEVVALPILEGNPEYTRWISQSLK